MTKITFLKPRIPRTDLTFSAIEPAHNVKSNAVEFMTKDLRENYEENRDVTHPSRCQAIGRMKQFGWIVKTDYDLYGDEQVDDGNSEIFLKAYDLDDREWIVTKYMPEWGVYIPPGYELMTIPTLYHFGRFFTLPGVLDGNEGLHFMNAFIIMKKNDIIPAGTPIAQWFLKKKEDKPEVEIREPDADDIAGSFFKTNMCLKRDDFLLAKRNKLFYNPLYGEEDYDG